MKRVKELFPSRDLNRIPRAHVIGLQAVRSGFLYEFFNDSLLPGCLALVPHQRMPESHYAAQVCRMYT